VTETSVAPRRMSGRIAAAEAKKSTQSTLNSFFADKMLLKKLESSKRVA